MCVHIYIRVCVFIFHVCACVKTQSDRLPTPRHPTCAPPARLDDANTRELTQTHTHTHTHTHQYNNNWDWSNERRNTPQVCLYSNLLTASGSLSVPHFATYMSI